MEIAEGQGQGAGMCPSKLNEAFKWLTDESANTVDCVCVGGWNCKNLFCE